MDSLFPMNQKNVYGNILSTEMKQGMYQAITKSLYQFYDSNGSKNFVILVDTVQNHFIVMPFRILKKVMYERKVEIASIGIFTYS